MRMHRDGKGCPTRTIQIRPFRFGGILYCVTVSPTSSGEMTTLRLNRNDQGVALTHVDSLPLPFLSAPKAVKT
ncbi:outer membrane protein [Anopheles sinensis]|uniref:Outer membrane protein n=1 Tax=Anopheles sinensis TaxID=74873 RepID=A0A084VZD8_ANOSI|nr:outer membrane protein [Anopheles sinensis]